MEKVSFAGWRIKEGREDEWRHDVPSWYPHHLSSLESWFEARERERDKKRVKKYRGEIDSSIDFDFEEREQLPPSSYLSLSLSAPSWPRFPTVAPLITPPLPPLFLAARCQLLPFSILSDSRGVAGGCLLASDAETSPEWKESGGGQPRRFWVEYLPSSLGGGGRKGFCGCLIRQRGWGKSF